MRMLLSSAWIAAGLALAGCGGGPAEPAAPTLEGSWAGAASGISLTLILSESDGSITGAGSLSASNGSIQLSVSGSHTHPDVSLVLHSTGHDDAGFEGEFSDEDRVEGRLNGSGFENFRLTLERQ